MTMLPNCKPLRFLLFLLFVSVSSHSFAQNLLINGDFESGGAGTGFQTNYFIASTPGTSNPRQYNILTNPFTMNNAFFSNTVDHTFGNGTGRMMVVDGSGNANDKVWELVNGGSIGVISGRTYIFSYWIRSISASNTPANSAIIRVYTNGTTSAPVLIAGSQTCPTGNPSPWVQVSYRWTATTSNAQIWLTDEQTSGGGAGNDFALDDLTLVEDRGPLGIRFHPSDPSCPGVTTGGIFVQGTGGTPPYLYSLNGGPFQAGGYFSVPVSAGNQVRVIDSKNPVPDTVSSLPANLTVNAAFNPLVVTPGDQSLCNTASVQLNASGGGSGYAWTASTAPGVANLSATNIANPTAAPTATTTYTVTSQAPGANLVANPQFELGDSLFYTDYKFYISTTNQKAYGISVNAQLFGASFSACTDFNNPGTGRMMVVDGSTTANDKVWCQQIAVTPNTSYTFSYRLQTLALPNPAQIETLINGVSVGIVTAPSTVCSWTQVSYVWNSGASTSANICLYDRVLAPIGNDFALDDIFFTTVCTISKSLTITVGSLAAPVVSTPVQPSCTAPTGSFTVSAPLGIQYEYSINGTSYQAGSTFSGLAPGTYQVTVKDINSNCVSAATAVTINNVPALPAAPAIGTPTQPTCTVPTGSFTITAPLGANLSYNINGGAYQAGISFSGLAPNSYAVTVRDNNTGCVSAATNITINAVPGAPAAPTVGIPTQPTCTVPTGSFTVTAPLGANLSYNINGGTYQAATTFSGLAPNTYAVTVRDNNTGCVSTATNITINAVPGAPAAPALSTPTQPTCTVPTGSFTVTAPLGANLSYNINGGIYQAGTTFSGLAPNTYAVTVRDNNTGCVSTATNITINAVPGAPAAPTMGTPTQPTCTVPTGSFTVTAPLGANLSYNINGGTYQPGTSFSGLAPNTYAVTVRDNNTGCVSTATNIAINAVPGAPAAPTMGTPTQPTCTVPTGSFTVTAPLGANLSYNINGGTYQPGTSFSGLAPNTYAVTVRDNNTGCVSTATNITINAVPGAPAAPTMGTPTQPTCTVPTGSFTITAPLGANLSYNINGGIYQAGTTFSGLAPNTYAVTVRDNNTGCVSAATNITINAVPGAPAAPALSTPTQPTCTVLTGSFTVTAPLGANLSYNINGGTYQAGTTFSGLAPNTYAVTVRDNNTGCVSAATNIAINAVPGAPAAPTMGTPTQPTCTVPTGSFTITAPLGANLSYNINGGIYQAGTTFSGLAPNTYAVTVRDNNTGCVSAATNITINAAPAAPPVPVLSVVQPTCSAATAQINVLSPAGVEYSFDNGLSFQLSNSFTAQPGNTYQVLVRNAAGCLSASVPAIINPAPSRPPAPQLSLQQPTCTVPTGIITVTAPAAGVEYSFDNGVSFQAGNVSLPLTGGATYPVRVRNAAGCVSDATQAVLIPQPATPPAPQVTGTVNYCQGASAVALTATGTSLLWYTGAAGGTGSAVAPVPATSTAGSVPYYVSQTLNGCEGPRAVITVQVSAAPPLPSVSSPVSYCQGVTASPLSPVAAGLLWYTAPVGGIGVSSLTPSTSLPGSFAYYVSETVNGCEGPRAAVQVQVSPAPALGADREAGICTGEFFNLAVVYANTAVPVSFELNGTPVARPDSLTLSGTYAVVADGGNGCRDTALVNLQVQPAVVAFAGNDTIAVLGQPFQLVASGGGTGGTYRWTDLGPSFTAQFSDPLIANPTVILHDPLDSLRVDVTDRWGCRGSAIIRVTVLAGPAFYVPTAFSPNGDGLNDIFRPIPVGFGKLRYFRVFNRFGELVFETSRYLDGWDGMYKGKAQQPGNYVWVLQAEGRNGGLVERKGNVVLVR